MPAYNFQQQFVPKILDRSKPHTIRRVRKRRTRKGDTLYLYTGLRTKSCQMVAISTCVKVEPILIHPVYMTVLIADRVTGAKFASAKYIKELAHRDGFSEPQAFFDFFKRYSAEELKDLEIIWWDVGDLFMPVMGTNGEIKLQLGGSK